MKKNKDLKTALLSLSVILVLCIVLYHILALWSYQKLSNEYYQAYASLLEDVKQQYPDFDEEKWIAYLNGKDPKKSIKRSIEGNAERTKEKAIAGDEEQNAEKKIEKDAEETGVWILKRYGLFEQNMIMEKQKKQFLFFIFMGDVLFLFLLCLIFFLFYRYFKKRTKRIDELTSYLKRVEHGDYALSLTENNEDELSLLKNELYTVTVMLKESADLSKKQKKALSDSVSDISHQIKTPLTSMMVMLDNLSDDENMPVEIRRKFVNEITKQCNHINWLVITLLKLSRFDAGVVEFIKKEVILYDIAASVVEKLEMIAELKQLEMVISGDRDSVVLADAHWIGEAMSNLIKNAIEHSHRNQKIDIFVSDNPVYTSVFVKDYGEGMDKEECKHVFDRFYKSSKSGEDSIGIGLSLANEIVKQHGGYLRVDSKPGEGTTFEMRLVKIFA